MSIFAAPQVGPSYVEIDSVKYPLVPGSEIQMSPLNPFSPSLVAGNQARVASQRHAVRVWDDFTQGMGFEDDNEEHGGYAYGNLDTREPGQATMPTSAVVAGSASGYTTTGRLPVRAQYMVDPVSNNYAFLTWDYQFTTNTLSVVKTFKGTNINAVALTSANEQVSGVAEWGGWWFMMTYDNVTNTSRMYRIIAISATGVPTIGTVFTGVGSVFRFLVNYDSKLVTYDASNRVYKQWDGVSAFTSYIGGIVPAAFNENHRQLFVWTDKSGSGDALYTLTTHRIMVYDEEGEQWEPFYNFAPLWAATNGYCHVNARDNTLLFAPLDQPYSASGKLNDNLLAFSPGTVDSWEVNKEHGLPTDVTFTPASGHLASAPVVLASGSHWLFAFMHTQAAGTTTGLSSMVLARNDQGGWTPIFDANVANGASAFSPIIGGGYGGGRMLVLTLDGNWWDIAVPDDSTNHPRGTYEVNRAYFLRSGRVFNGQQKTLKMASHMEVTFKTVPAGTVSLDFRVATGSTVGTPSFSNSPNLAGGTRTMTWDLAGYPNVYLWCQWQLNVNGSDSAAPPIVESVALYYTYFQDNHYAYSFVIDLTVETWKKNNNFNNFFGKSRSFLQSTLLAAATTSVYHTFAYNRFDMRESITKADMSLARREMADNGGGIYPTTMRDLEP